METIVMNGECKICGKSSGHEMFTCCEMMFGTREEFIYFLCAGCGCLQLAEVPTNMASYYPPDYYSFGTFPASPIPALKDSLKKTWLTYLLTGQGIFGKILVSLLGRPSLPQWMRAGRLKPSDRILDVGCGAGGLLVELRQMGFNCLHGIDPYVSGDLHYPNGVIVWKKELFEINGTYDVIMLHHSFEHMTNQISILGEIRRLLSPLGRVIIRIPTVSSYAWRHYRTDWVQLDAPRHLFLHSVQSMKILAERLGFVIDNIEYDSNANQFWGSEQIRKGIPYADKSSYRVNPDASIFSADEINDFKTRAQRLNEEKDGDQAVFLLSPSEAKKWSA